MKYTNKFVQDIPTRKFHVVSTQTPQADLDFLDEHLKTSYYLETYKLDSLNQLLTKLAEIQLSQENNILLLLHLDFEITSDIVTVLKTFIELNSKVKACILLVDKFGELLRFGKDIALYTNSRTLNEEVCVLWDDSSIHLEVQKYSSGIYITFDSVKLLMTPPNVEKMILHQETPFCLTYTIGGKKYKIVFETSDDKINYSYIINSCIHKGSMPIHILHKYVEHLDNMQVSNSANMQAIGQSYIRNIKWGLTLQD